MYYKYSRGNSVLMTGARGRGKPIIFVFLIWEMYEYTSVWYTDVYSSVHQMQVLGNRTFYCDEPVTSVCSILRPFIQVRIISYT